MTVRELIKELQMIENQDAEIEKNDEAGGSYPIKGVRGWKFETPTGLNLIECYIGNPDAFTFEI